MNEREVLKAVLKEPKTSRMLKRLHKKLGAKVSQAWKLVKSGSVVKYTFKPSGRVMWTVIGDSGEYLLYEAVGWCSCEDFFQKFESGYVCKHVVAQELAEVKGTFETVQLADSEFDKFMSRWQPPYWRELST